MKLLTKENLKTCVTFICILAVMIVIGSADSLLNVIGG